MDAKELKSAVEVIKDRLYFVCARKMPRAISGSKIGQPRTAFFIVDDKFTYEPFFEDFGPINLGQTVQFCKMTEEMLQAPENSDRRVYIVTSFDGHKRSNAAYLTCAYMLIVHKKTPEEAFKPFVHVYPPFIPFRDASQSISTYGLSILDCLRGVYKAMMFKFFDYATFNHEEYLKYEKVENGDMNWIVPGKFLAFKSPSNNKGFLHGIIQLTPEDYSPQFRKWGITAVIRLNKKVYDRKKFIDNGINHFDLFFVDGGLPSEMILKKFFDITEKESGAVAVHCKAGLGRTGTCIACYLMKHYRFTAAEAIGWLRICRPGSVIGIQQHFLHEIQAKMWKAGEKSWKAKLDRINLQQYPSVLAELKADSAFDFSGGNTKENNYSVVNTSYNNLFEPPQQTNDMTPRSMQNQILEAEHKHDHKLQKKAVMSRLNASKIGMPEMTYSQEANEDLLLLPNNQNSKTTTSKKQRPMTTTGLSRTIPLLSSPAIIQKPSHSAGSKFGLQTPQNFLSNSPYAAPFSSPTNQSMGKPPLTNSKAPSPNTQSQTTLRNSSKLFVPANTSSQKPTSTSTSTSKLLTPLTISKPVTRTSQGFTPQVAPTAPIITNQNRIKSSLLGAPQSTMKKTFVSPGRFQM